MRSRLLRLAAAFAASTLLASAALAQARLYLLDGASARIVFTCEMFGLDEARGQFTRFAGHVLLDETRPEAADTQVIVDATSMTFEDPDLLGDLQGPDFFHIDRYPDLSFRAKGATIESPGVARIDGHVTLRGRTRPMTLHVRYAPASGDGAPVQISADADLDRSDFGMTAHRLIVGDRVSIAISGEARIARPPKPD